MKKKILDENGRLFGRISIIDVLVILVIAVLAVAFGTKKAAPAIMTAVAPMDDVTYELYVENMPDGRLQALREGDPVYDGDTRSPIGTIEKIEVEDCVITMQKADGTYVKAEIPERNNVRLTVAAQAKLNDHGMTYINRVSPISVGWSLNIYTPGTRFSGAVLKIES